MVLSEHTVSQPGKCQGNAEPISSELHSLAATVLALAGRESLLLLSITISSRFSRDGSERIPE